MISWLGWSTNAREIQRREWKTSMKLSLSLTEEYGSIHQFT